MNECVFLRYRKSSCWVVCQVDTNFPCLESNTRGAVVVGAMGAGGIGLQFLGSLQTGKDWENVAYISLVVLITVVVIDILSAKARRKLIG